MRTTSYLQVESRDMEITEADTSVEHGLKPYRYRYLRAFYKNFQLQWEIYRTNVLWAIAEEKRTGAEK